jgi:hypothetical protein
MLLIDEIPSVVAKTQRLFPSRTMHLRPDGIRLPGLITSRRIPNVPLAASTTLSITVTDASSGPVQRGFWDHNSALPDFHLTKQRDGGEHLDAEGDAQSVPVDVNSRS